MVQAFDVLNMLLAEKLLRGHHCRNFAMKIEDPTVPNFVKYIFENMGTMQVFKTCRPGNPESGYEE